MRLRLYTLTASVLLASFASAQVPPGQYIAAIRNGATGEMFFADPESATSTALTVSATLGADWANCVTMTTPVTGFVGTFNNPAIYSITVTGTSVLEKKLNTNAIGTAEVVQVQHVAGTVYFAQGSATESAIYSVPANGGAATQLVDLTQVAGFPAGSIVNGLAATLTHVYAVVWTAGLVFEYDINAKTTKLLLTLPVSKQVTAGFYPVNCQMQGNPLASKVLAVAGLYGDITTIDVSTGKLIDHFYQATAAGTGRNSLTDSMAENPSTGDWGTGTRDGAINVVLPVDDGQIARAVVDGMGAGATPNLNRVVGIWFNDGGGDYAPIGGGCAGVGGFIPTSTAMGSPIQGNTNFALRVNSTRSGSATALLVIGNTMAAPYPVDLGIAGAPGCMLRTNMLLVIGGTATGITDGFGSGSIKAPLPMRKANVYTQWGVYDPSNNLGVAVSDCRNLKL